MSRTVRYDSFRGLVTSLGDRTPEGSALSILNADVRTGAIDFRPGYRNLTAKRKAWTPTFRRAYGLSRVAGYSASYVFSEEFLMWLQEDTVSPTADTVRMFSVSPSTYAITEVKDGVTSVNLLDSEYHAVGFDSVAYVMNRSDPKAPYKHTIGDATSFDSLIPFNVLTAPAGLSSAINASPYTWDAAVTAGSYTGVATSGVITVTTSELANLVTHSNAVGAASFTFDITAGTGQEIDFSEADVITVQFDAPVATSDWRINTDGFVLTLIDGVNEYPASGYVVREDNGAAYPRIQCYFDQKNRSLYTAIDFIRLDYPVIATDTTAGDRIINIKVYRSHADVADSAPLVSNEVQYAISYYDTVNLTESPLTTILASPYSHRGYRSGGTFRPDVVDALLYFPVSGQAAVDRVRIYLKCSDGLYHRIDEVPDTDGAVICYTTDFDARSLPAYDGFTFPTGAISAFQYKGGMVYLYPGGKENIKYSAVGDAERLYLSTDPITDTNRAATYSMADNFADEPVGGVQAGDAAFIAGLEGVYSQTGDYPASMSPSRKLPGSYGCAGTFALARWVSDGGEPGIVYLDRYGRGVWFYGQSQAFQADQSGRPIEVSAAVRDEFRRFLIDEQQAEFGDLDLAQGRVAVDEASGDLWILIKRRAMVLTAPSLVDGTRQWLRHEFEATYDETLALATSTSTVSEVYTSRASAVRSDASGVTVWDVASFTNVTTGGRADQSTAAPALGIKSQALNVTGLRVSNIVPLNATFTDASYLRIYIQNASASTVGTIDYLYLWLSGVPVGTNLMAVPVAVPTSDSFIDVLLTGGNSLATLGITPEDINLGRMGVTLGVIAGAGASSFFVRVRAMYIVPVYTSPASPPVLISDFTGDQGVPTLPSSGWTVADFDNTDPTKDGIYATLAAAGVSTNLKILNIRPKVYPPTNATITKIIARVFVTQTGVAGGVVISDTGIYGVNRGTVSSVNLGTSLPIPVADNGYMDYELTLSEWDANDFLRGGFGMQLAYTASGAGVSDVVSVKAVHLRIEMTGSEAENGYSRGIGWQAIAFSPRRQLWALRDTGHIDEFAWDSTYNLPLTGNPYRDGGYVPGEGHWMSGDQPGEPRRALRMGIATKGRTNPADFYGTVYTESLENGSRVTFGNTFYGKCGTVCVGREHKYSVTFTENSPRITAMEVEVSKTSERLTGL